MAGVTVTVTLARTGVVLACVASTLLAPTVVNAQSSNPPRTPPPVARTQSAAAPPPAPVALQEMLPRAAASVGVSTCLGAIQRVAPVISLGAERQDLLLDWDRRQPDQGPLYALVGVDYGDRAAASFVSAVPDGQGGCSFATERVAAAPVACSKVAESELSGLRRTQLLPSMNVFTDPADPAATVVLIDAAPGCLVIRRHVQYRWRGAK